MSWGVWEFVAVCGKAKVSGDLLGAEIFPVYKMHRRAYFLKMYFLAGLGREGTVFSSL